MKIKTKLILSFSCIVLLVGCAGLVGTLVSQKIYRTFYFLVYHKIPVLTTLYEIQDVSTKIEFQTLQFELMEHATTQVAGTLGGEKKYDLLASMESMNQAVERLKALAPSRSGDENSFFEDITVTKENIILEAMELLRSYETGQPPNVIFIQKQKLEHERKQLRGILREAIEVQLDELDREKSWRKIP